MLCERCQKSEATVFSTFIVRHGEHAGDSTVRRRNLCHGCAHAEGFAYAESPDVASQMAAALEAGCGYCGEKGVTIMCQPCAAEFRRISQEKGVAFRAAKPTREDMERLVNIMREVEEHMKKWVSERGPHRP